MYKLTLITAAKGKQPSESRRVGNTYQRVIEFDTPQPISHTHGILKGAGAAYTNFRLVQVVPGAPDVGYGVDIAPIYVGTI